MHRPLIFPFAGLIAGIIIGNFFGLPYIFLSVALIFILFSLILSLRKKWWVACFLLIFCFAVILGIFDIQKQLYSIRTDRHVLQYAESGRKTVEGIVIESPSSYPDKNVLIVRCVRIINNGIYVPVAGNVRLVIPADLNFSYGDFIRFHSSLKKNTKFQKSRRF